MGAGWTVAIVVLYYLALKWFEKKGIQAVDPWAKGASGELRVGNTLKQLESENFRILHDLPFFGGNIDHVVVGRSGVFVVETKACKWVDERAFEVENVRLTRPQFLRGMVTGKAKFSKRDVAEMAKAVSCGVVARPPRPAPRRAPARPKPHSSSA